MSDLGTNLKRETTGCKLEISSTSASRSLTDSQRLAMAEVFHADVRSVRASREIISRKLEPVKRVFRVLSAAREYWRAYTIKYEDGVRLIRTSRVADMNERMAAFQAELADACEELKDAWPEVIADARVRLADLFVEGDYDFDPSRAFYLTISYPAIEPDMRIKELAPDLYEAEAKRISAKFEEAACLAEEALRAEFKGLVDSLAEKLTSEVDENGKRKVLRESALENITKFADRFKALSVTSDPELDALVERVREMTGGVDLKSLKQTDVKTSFADALSGVREQMDSLFTSRPVRKFNLD